MHLSSMPSARARTVALAALAAAILPLLAGCSGTPAAISVIDTGSGAKTSTIRITDPEDAVVAPDGRSLYVLDIAADGMGTVLVIDTGTNAVVRRIPAGGKAEDVEISPDGRTLYILNVTGTDQGSVSVIDAAKGTVARTIPVKGSPEGMTISPDGRRIYFLNDASSSS